ncbi:hypothetical protein Ocin01_19946 [Orchesella cincta]|uniref:Uncharacterized protein n=1 Tax=Orchesella cincta TaxID=48709 RepID=A0A1D2M193_ORCCI|nr:hypothetical protein Ocin01_19946 [Orchesella cincta]
MTSPFKLDVGIQRVVEVFIAAVCDKEAINLDSHSRTAILEYLTVIRGWSKIRAKKVQNPNVDISCIHSLRSSVSDY